MKRIESWSCGRVTRVAAVAAVLAATLAARPAQACSVCNCGDPLVAVADGHGRGDGDVRVGLEVEMLRQRAGSDEEPGVTDVLEQTTFRLTGVYNPVERLALVAAVPIVRKELTMDPGVGAVQPLSDLTGLGDVEVGARYELLDAVSLGVGRRHGLAVSLGSQLPTGRSSARKDGERIDQHGQLGTGGYGPFAGLTWRLEQGAWSALAAATGRLRTENGDGYRFGHALLWTAQGRWAALPWLGLGLGVEGRNAGRDRQDGAAVENTGGLVLAAVPSVHLRVANGLWLAVRAQLPVLANLAGEQEVLPVFTAGVAWEP